MTEEIDLLEARVNTALKTFHQKIVADVQSRMDKLLEFLKETTPGPPSEHMCERCGATGGKVGPSKLMGIRAGIWCLECFNDCQDHFHGPCEVAHDYDEYLHQKALLRLHAGLRSAGSFTNSTTKMITLIEVFITQYKKDEETCCNKRMTPCTLVGKVAQVRVWSCSVCNKVYEREGTDDQ